MAVVPVLLEIMQQRDQVTSGNDPGADGGSGLANVFRYGPSSPITYAGGGGGGGAGPGGVGGSGGTPTAGSGNTRV